VSDVAVDRLRLRGPHARRLARVAARALPRALDRALADVDDVRVEQVRVVLDLDPDEYDDETLAVLWADAIRARLHRPGGAADAASENAPIELRLVEGEAGPGPVEVLTAARELLANPEVARTPLPSVLLRLASPEIAGWVSAQLGEADWAVLVERLRGTLMSRRPRAIEPGAQAPAPVDADPRLVGPAVESSLSDPLGPVSRPPTPPGPAAAHFDELTPVLGVLEELAGTSSGLLDPSRITRAAGLVLLHPWLADHCRHVVALHPGLDSEQVREAALAALVAEDEAVLRDDPLIRWLAGHSDLDEPTREHLALAHEAEVRESASRVLASFAALLPGFEKSSSTFVQDAWIARLGVLDLDRDPVQLTAATHPLDVLLPLLPYPLALIKLPWTAPLSVRFRP